ncbi:hypothetical protein SY86_08300 [Erwinia tracheiphila]|uniref:Uncharacterized protein n=1 Tax=Erwinia tracheiphila TaxID=65700 RepID=A0A0M2KDX9_9GAMM|nr:hypothetical protein AV903_13205 [Erwinia tracheiphila]KKF35423.1 hypothetical protein SY86_08300 [Erwinia tracheiphila]
MLNRVPQVLTKNRFVLVSARCYEPLQDQHSRDSGRSGLAFDYNRRVLQGEEGICREMKTGCPQYRNGWQSLFSARQ